MKKATLFTVPASHPSRGAELMLEHKGVPYRRIDLITAAHRGLLRVLGFPRGTVPALRLAGRRVQGSREISAALDELVPERPLFPSDPERRAAVVEAERWGDEVYQSVPRRIVWASLKRDRSTVRSYLEGAKLGIPVSLAALTAPHPAYAAMGSDEREAVVLARTLGFSVDEIAARLEISRADVLGRISRGLRRTLPPRRDCAGGASPAHAGRAS